MIDSAERPKERLLFLLSSRLFACKLFCRTSCARTHTHTHTEKRNEQTYRADTPLPFFSLPLLCRSLFFERNFLYAFVYALRHLFSITHSNTFDYILSTRRLSPTLDTRSILLVLIHSEPSTTGPGRIVLLDIHRTHTHTIVFAPI